MDNQKLKTTNLITKLSIIILLILITFVICYFCYSFHRFNNTWKTKAGSVNLAEVSKESFINFPKSAVLLKSYYHKEWDEYTLFAMLEIDRSDVADFMHGFSQRWKWSTKSEDKFKDGVLYAPAWWRPDAVKSFTLAHAGKGQRRQSVLISTDYQKRAVVYILVYR